LDMYIDWTDNWRVSVNASKSTAVLFSRRRKMPQERPRIGRTYLPWSNEVKYLGLHLDRRLTWRIHAQTLVQRATARLGQLFPLLASSAMTRRLGKIIVNTYLLPVITYAAPVWGYLAAMHKRRLKSVYHRGFKLSAKIPRLYSSALMRRGLGVRSLDDVFRRLARRFYVRAARTSNPLIADLGRYRI